ncbi:MAG: hypothetical protein AAFN77_07435 [Planctomycetota bacterium]
MLEFNQGQLYQMVENDDDFVNWYKDRFMPEHLPEFHFSPIQDESKREMILQGRAYARKFNLKTVPAHAHFITMMFNIGPNFFTFPGFRHALTKPWDNEEQVIDRLYNVSFEHAERAMKGADDRYWWPDTITSKERR